MGRIERLRECFISVKVCKGSWVDARTLYKELGVGKVFGAWIVGRIDKYDFTEDDDYKVCFPKRESKKGSGGHNIKDYSLTLDMAKELSMVENNKIGKLIEL